MLKSSIHPNDHDLLLGKLGRFSETRNTLVVNRVPAW